MDTPERTGKVVTYRPSPTRPKGGYCARGLTVGVKKTTFLGNHPTRELAEAAVVYFVETGTRPPKRKSGPPPKTYARPYVHKLKGRERYEALVKHPDRKSREYVTTCDTWEQAEAAAWDYIRTGKRPPRLSPIPGAPRAPKAPRPPKAPRKRATRTAIVRKPREAKAPKPTPQAASPRIDPTAGWKAALERVEMKRNQISK